MKKYLILLFLLLPCLANAQWQEARMNPYVAGAAAGTVYTDCSNIGDAQFMWNGEHSSGSTYGCKNNTTTINGTATGAEIVDSDSDPGTGSPSSGNNVVKVNAADERLVFTVTAADIFSSSEGRWCGDVYIAASTGNNYIFRHVVDANNYVAAFIANTGAVQVWHAGNSSTVAVASTATVSDTTWTRVCARWSVANNQVAVKICTSPTDCTNSWKTACPSGCDTTDSDTVTAFTSEPASIRMMGGSTETDATYIDNVFQWTTSGL